MGYDLPFPAAAAIAFSALGILYVTITVLNLLRRRIESATVIMAFGMFLLVALLFSAYFPQAPFLHLPQQVASKLRELDATKEGDVVMTVYAEPSLAFYQGGTIRPRPDDYLFTEAPERWPRWVVTFRDTYANLPDDRRELLHPVATFHGLNYNEPFGITDVLILRHDAPVSDK
jgi:hypothetical protein